MATTQYRIGKATVAAYLQKLGKFETHQIRANSQEEFAYVLTTLADGDKKIHGAQWNDMMVAKPNETVQAVLARDRQIGDAGARNYSPLDKVAARLAKLSHSTPEPVAKERVRNESALVAAVKAESLENPIFGFMRVAKNTKEATTLTRWAKANLLGAAPTEQKIANLRRNLNDLVLRSDAQEIWTDEMLNRELGALATR